MRNTSKKTITEGDMPRMEAPRMGEIEEGSRKLGGMGESQGSRKPSGMEESRGKRKLIFGASRSREKN